METCDKQNGLRKRIINSQWDESRTAAGPVRARVCGTSVTLLLSNIYLYVTSHSRLKVRPYVRVVRRAISSSCVCSLLPLFVLNVHVFSHAVHGPHPPVGTSLSAMAPTVTSLHAVSLTPVLSRVLETTRPRIQPFVRAMPARDVVAMSESSVCHQKGPGFE